MSNDNGRGTAVATVGDVRRFLEREEVVRQIELAAVETIDVPRLIRTAMAVATKNPLLLRCTPASWGLALQQSAELGMMPTGELGKAYLIPRWNRKLTNNEGVEVGGYEVNFQLGYRGLADLARRSPEIRNVTAELVYVDDLFEIHKGDQPRLIHEPYLGGRDGDPVIRGAYAISWWTDGSFDFEWMTKAQIDAVGATSETWGKTSSPWSLHYGEMARKTVLRRHCKSLPLQVDVERFMSIDDAGDFPQYASRARVARVNPQVEAMNRSLGILPPEPAEEEGGEEETETEQLAELAEEERDVG